MTKKKEKYELETEAQEVFKRKEFNPLSELVDLCLSSETDISLKSRILLELSSFIYRKADKQEAVQVQQETTYEERLRRIRAVLDSKEEDGLE